MRNTRGVRLTEHGEILLSYARRILALYKEAEHRLSRDSGGLVRIGAPEYSALLGQFSARYPAAGCKSSSVSVPTSPPFSTRASSIS